MARELAAAEAEGVAVLAEQIVQVTELVALGNAVAAERAARDIELTRAHVTGDRSLGEAERLAAHVVGERTVALLGALDVGVEGTEECDGPLANDMSCEALGFTEGPITCSMSTCQLDVCRAARSAATALPRATSSVT